MPKADSRWATRTPIRPRPTMPAVFSYSSTPVYLLRFHSPRLSAALAGAMCRAAASSRPTASSAALTMFDCGRVDDHDAGLRRGLDVDVVQADAGPGDDLEAAGRGEHLGVDLRGAADQQGVDVDDGAAAASARSAPSQCRTSKSGPSASMVAGESSSAMSTTGLVTPSSLAALYGLPLSGCDVSAAVRRAVRRSARSLERVEPASRPGSRCRATSMASPVQSVDVDVRPPGYLRLAAAVSRPRS